MNCTDLLRQSTVENSDQDEYELFGNNDYTFCIRTSDLTIDV